MSYLDSLYKNLPSVWYSNFEDKNIVDSILEHSLSICADSYEEILRDTISKSIYSRNMVQKVSSSRAIFRDIDVATKLDANGDIVFQAIPISTKSIRASYICDTPSIFSSKYSAISEDFRLITDKQEILGIADIVGSSPILRAADKLLLIKSNFFDIYSADSSYVEVYEDLNTILEFPPTIVDNSYITNCISDKTDIQLTISRIGIPNSEYTIAIPHTSVNTTTINTIILPTHFRLDGNTNCHITVGGIKYTVQCKTISTKVKYIDLYAINSIEDNLDSYSKVGFMYLSNPYYSLSQADDLVYSLHSIDCTGFTKSNVKRLLNIASGSQLIQYGGNNLETLLNFNTSNGVLVTNLKTYRLPLNRVISLAVLDSAKKVDYIDSDFYRVIKDSTDGQLIISAVYSLLSSYTNIKNSAKIKIEDSDTEYAAIYIGRDFILVKSEDNIKISQQYCSSLTLIIDSLDVEISGDFIFRNILSDSTELIQKQAITDYFDVDSSVNTDYISSKNSIYLPSSLYNTLAVRRLINNKLYKSKVGWMPLHRVGDYKISVQPNVIAYKSSAYYIYDDFVRLNSTILKLNSVDLRDIRDYTTVVELINRCIPVSNIMLTSFNNALADYVSFTKNMSDIIIPKLKISFSDIKPTVVYNQYDVQEFLLVKYCELEVISTLSIAVADSASILCETGACTGHVVKITSKDSTKILHIQIDTEYKYQELGKPIEVNSAGIIDFDIQGVVNHSGSSIGGSVTAVIGSSLPLSDPSDTVSAKAQSAEYVTISSRGPSVKVIQQ
jgi:hypothetical protein